ncbi:MAG: hypothetical protein ACREL5_05925 [Gemmatimonadales bacterium]
MQAISATGALAAAVLLAAAPAAGQDPDATTAGPAAVCGACRDGLRAGLIAIPVAVSDTGRPMAVEYSNAYYTRLTIHRIGSYLELPLFTAEYFVGQKLLKEEQTSTDRHLPLRSTHNALAAGIGVLFAVNTVTGVWNLVEARHDPNGRTRRWLHSLTMLAADAGFLWTASLGGQAKHTTNGASNHRAVAIGSFSLATASTLMMWLWK